MRNGVALFSVLCLFWLGAFAQEPAPIVWRGQEPGTLPVTLYRTPEEGVMALEWRRTFEPGYYELRAVFGMDTWRRDFVFTVDQEPVAQLTAYFTEDGAGDHPVYRMPFAIEAAGEHVLRIDRKVWRAAAQEPELVVESVEVRRVAAPGPPPVDRPLPETLAPLWGWMPSSNYQRPERRSLSREYWDRRCVEEPGKWGSSYMQIYGHAGPAYTSDGDFSSALAYAHKHGYLIDEHGPWPFMEGDRPLEFEETLAAIDAHVAEWLDRTERPWDRAMDSWESEDGNPIRENRPLYGKENLIACYNTTWQYHPGATIGDCFKEALADKGYCENILNWGFHGPNYVKVLMCAGSVLGDGYDDRLSMHPLPDDLAFKNEYNWVYRASQADCRPYSNNRFGGGTMPDWIVKQAADFFRPNAEAIAEGRTPIASAINWLGEPQSNLPEHIRDYVYAASMDPCRAALAYRLAGTGFDGKYRWQNGAWFRGLKGMAYGEKARAWMEAHDTMLKTREWHPATSARLHNGALAVTTSASGQPVKLEWDSAGLGEFDRGAPALTLSDELIRTTLGGEGATVDRLSFPAGPEARTTALDLAPGVYEAIISMPAAAPAQGRIFIADQYLGAAAAGPSARETRLPFVIAEGGTVMLQARPNGRDGLPRMDVEIAEVSIESGATVAELGRCDDSSVEFGLDAPGYGIRAAYDADSAQRIVTVPPGLDGDGSLPRAFDIDFHGEAGSYLLTVRARAVQEDQRLDITLNPHLYSRLDGPRDVAPDESLGAFAENDWYRMPAYFGRIHSQLLSQDWRTYQFPVVVVHPSGVRGHKVTLDLPEDSGRVEFDAIRLTKLPVERRIEEFGGRRAVMRETFRFKGEAGALTETRTYRSIAHEPSLFIRIARSWEGGQQAATTWLDLSRYEACSTAGEEAPSGGALFKLEDRDGVLPPLRALVRTEGKAAWREGRIAVTGADEGAIDLWLTLRRDATPVAPPHVTKLTGADIAGGYEPANGAAPGVALLRISEPKPGPYFVREDGWWTVRGAQRLRPAREVWKRYLADYDAWYEHATPGEMPAPPYVADLLPVWTPGGAGATSGEPTQVQPWGYIDGFARPGWGCQYLVQLRGVEQNACEARVPHVTSYMFAPRVAFAGAPITAAWLDGEPWAYHDAQHVYLPQRPGQFKIEVARGGAARPTLTATAASVKRAYRDGEELVIEHEFPPYVFKLPEGLDYALLIAYDLTETSIAGVEGGELLRQGPLGGVVRAQDAVVRVSFGPGVEPEPPVPGLGADGALERSPEGAVHVRIGEEYARTGRLGGDLGRSRAYFVCDLAGLRPSDAEGLQTATLRFYVLHAIREGEPRPLTLYAVSEADDQGLRPGIWEAAAAPAARVPEGVASGWRALDVTKSVAADLRAGRSQSVFFLEMPELPEEGPCILSVTQLERRDEYAPRFEVRRAE